MSAGASGGASVGNRGTGIQAHPHHGPVGNVGKSFPISKPQIPLWSLESCAFRKGVLVAPIPESAA